MNEKQRKLLIGIGVVVFLMLLYPPFHIQSAKGVFGQGYSWIFARPRPAATVDIGLLITQWLGVLMIGAIVYFLFRKDRQ